MHFKSGGGGGGSTQSLLKTQISQIHIVNLPKKGLGIYLKKATDPPPPLETNYRLCMLSSFDNSLMQILTATADNKKKYILANNVNQDVGFKLICNMFN